MSTRLPAAPYLNAFSTRFSIARINSSRSPSTNSGSDGAATLISTPRSRASISRPSTTCRTIGARSTGVFGCKCALSSMRESDNRSSISRAMRVACPCMMARNFVARGRILLGGALQRFNEPEERRERRAQLVTGIGDEVGAHFLDAAQRREVVERHQQDVGVAVAGAAELHRRHEGLEPAVERHALEEFHPLRLAPLGGAPYGIDQFRHAQGDQRRFAAAQGRRNAGCRLVECDHPAVAIEHDCRRRQSADQLLDQERLRMRGRAIAESHRAGRSVARAILAEQGPPRAAQPARPIPAACSVSAVVSHRR